MYARVICIEWYPEESQAHLIYGRFYILIRKQIVSDSLLHHGFSDHESFLNDFCVYYFHFLFF